MREVEGEVIDETSTIAERVRSDPETLERGTWCILLSGFL
jgi:hypothetical protein